MQCLKDDDILIGLIYKTYKHHSQINQIITTYIKITRKFKARQLHRH